MKRKSIWRALRALLVLAGSAALVGTQPIRLGLDLRGGTQIVLEAQDTRLWFGLSLATMVLALIGLLTQGLNFGIEFTGGRLIEYRNLRPTAPLAEVANDACLQTVPRTINSGMGALFILLALYFLGGETLTDFALALIVGIVVGRTRPCSRPPRWSWPTRNLARATSTQLLRRAPSDAAQVASHVFRKVGVRDAAERAQSLSTRRAASRIASGVRP